MINIYRYGRFFVVLEDNELLAVVVYLKGALKIAQRLGRPYVYHKAEWSAS